MLEKIPTEMTYIVQTPHFHFGHVGDRPFHRFVMPGLSLPLGLTEQTLSVSLTSHYHRSHLLLPCPD